MKADELTCAIEAVLTVALEPLSVQVLAETTGAERSEVSAALSEISTDLAEGNRGFVLVELGSGWRLQTNPDAAEVVQRFAQREVSTRLSTAALETLAIVAYRQPVTRAQIAALRGVNVDGVVRLLEQRGYIEIVGQADGPGQAILYGTGEIFLDRLGLASLDQLPRPETLLPDASETEQLAQDLPSTVAT
jgi:segregation and condensation protein B